MSFFLGPYTPRFTSIAGAAVTAAVTAAAAAAAAAIAAAAAVDFYNDRHVNCRRPGRSHESRLLLLLLLLAVIAGPNDDRSGFFLGRGRGGQSSK